VALLSWLDILLLLVGIVFVINGLIRGAVSQILGLLAFLLALYLTISLGPDIVKLIPYPKGGEGILRPFAILLIFVVSSLVFSRIAHLFSGILNRVFGFFLLKWLDGVIGAIIGALKAFVVSIVIILFILHIFPGGEGIIGRSFIATKILDIAKSLIGQEGFRIEKTVQIFERFLSS